MKKKIIAMVVMSAMAILLFAGCGSAQTETAKQSNASEPIAVSQLKEGALSSQDWLNHMENDLMKFWNNPDAHDISSGLFNTYLTNSGESYTLADGQLPEEITTAVQQVPDLMDAEYNYVRAHSRLTYSYGVAFHMTGNPEYLEMCRQGALALQNAFDENGGMYVKQNKQTGEWDQDASARTSQDLAYGITGMAMYYYLTHDESVLESILAAKDYIFETYYDEDKGYFTWLPKTESDDQVQLVAQLDQLYAYMILLTPELPEPHQSEWKADLKTIADILIEKFYSEKYGMFWGDVSTAENMTLGSAHVDFGHSVKTFWLLAKVGAIVDEPSYIEFAKSRIAGILESAYLEENGSWASKLNADGTINKDKEWWIFAELDQAAQIMALNDPSYYELLNNTHKYWLDVMVDHEHGEMWHMVDAQGTPVVSPPKTHNWKTSFHSFEHALFGYMAAADLNNENFEVYYALPSGEESVVESINPYLFNAETISVAKLDALAGMPAECCVYKVTYRDLAL